MKKLHVVCNGYSDGCEKQARELRYFLNQHQGEFEEGITYFFCGEDSKMQKETLQKYAPTEKVIFVWGKSYQPEQILKSMMPLLDAEGIYLFSGSYSGCELAVRAGKRKNGSSAVSVSDIEDTEEGIVIEKSIYSNHMQGKFLVKKMPFFLSLAKGIGLAKELPRHPIILSEIEQKEQDSFVLSQSLEKIEQKESLETAEILFVAGRGVGKKENIERLEKIAEKFHGKVGVSRPVAMNAWASMDRLIGVSGIMAHPKICITAGVSGAAAFFAGIAKSDFIAAINTNEKAPILKKADVAIIGEYAPILEALEKKIEERRESNL